MLYIFVGSNSKFIRICPKRGAIATIIFTFYHMKQIESPSFENRAHQHYISTKKKNLDRLPIHTVSFPAVLYQVAISSKSPCIFPIRSRPDFISRHRIASHNFSIRLKPTTTLTNILSISTYSQQVSYWYFLSRHVCRCFCFCCMCQCQCQLSEYRTRPGRQIMVHEVSNVCLLDLYILLVACMRWCSWV